MSDNPMYYIIWQEDGAVDPDYDSKYSKAAVMHIDKCGSLVEAESHWIGIEQKRRDGHHIRILGIIYGTECDASLSVSISVRGNDE